ncbi:PAS domain S-box protein [Sphingomonas qilianensis]|uniref:histidine kinase n=1 Tax=Sphingomonas qilianensis TaxID=1736690 RepID=A0ABU9XNV2_9SPHN
MTPTPLQAEPFALFINSWTDRALFLLDKNGRITTWNQGAALLTDWAPADIIGQPFALLYPPEDAARGMPAADLAEARHQATVRKDAWRIRRDGSEFLADATLVALHDTDGVFHGYGQSLYDVTTRKATEGALTDSEQHVRSILATVPDSMIVIDERGKILSFSSAAERLFGYREAELIGRNVNVLMPSPDRERHDQYLEHYLTTGEKRIIGIGRVVVGARRDGSQFPMELSVGETQSKGRRIFTGFVRDLTEQQRGELRLKELQSELIHVSRLSAMGTMASTLAHELNQPLTAIALYMEASRDLLIAPTAAMLDDLREAVTESAKEALRAGQIVRKLRDFVQRGEVETRIIALQLLIEEASSLALVGARERGVRAFFRFSPEAKQAVVDRVQIQQVIVNLLRNAVDAVETTLERDVTVTTARREAGMIEIAVADTGSGIDPAQLPRLFDAFATTKANGMGLGLSICRTIVEAHGGRIWAEPQTGGGSVFRFTVPSPEPAPDEDEDENDDGGPSDLNDPRAIT